MRDWFLGLVEKVREFEFELIGIVVYSLVFIAFIVWIFVCVRIVILFGNLILL